MYGPSMIYGSKLIYIYKRDNMYRMGTIHK